MDNIYNNIILGSGPAGITAAIYAARSNLKPLLLSGDTEGGQLIVTSLVENFPGFENGILGPDLMNNMIKQAENVGVEYIRESAIMVDLKNYPLKIVTGKNTYLTKSLIISTGATAKWLDIPGEKELMGKGVSGCATCDGMFFKEKEIVVVGGGDSAMEEALFLTKFASKVTIIHRKDSFRASSIMQKKVFDNPKIEILFESEVVKINGDMKVVSINIKNKDREYEFPTEGVFIAIGHNPNTSIFKDQIDLDGNGYIKVKDNTKTNIEGVFAAGDVADPIYRQAISSAGIGCIAAIDALHYLENSKKL